MDFKNYAPVVIPTLNRYKHFKRCLESLERCTGSEYTEVFVALDYPPSERYKDGWQEIDEYLQQKENKNGFKNLFVIRREHNYGISVVRESNIVRLLYDSIFDKYETFIFSEDDNVFSPNFLQYVNQGLQLYKDDDDCTAICCYNYDGLELPNYDYNIYLSREYSAWGIGCWSKKSRWFYDHLTIDYAKSIMSSWKKIWTLYKHEPRILNTVMLNIAINRPFGDTMRVCYQYLEDKYSVFPALSKVRNIGFDGTGTSIFKADDTHEKQVIDESSQFEMDIIERVVKPEVQHKVELVFIRSWILNVVIFIRVSLYYLFKIDILYFEQKRRNKSLFKKK